MKEIAWAGRTQLEQRSLLDTEKITSLIAHLGKIDFVWREGKPVPYAVGRVPGVSDDDLHIEEAILVGEHGNARFRFYGPAAVVVFILDSKPSGYDEYAWVELQPMGKPEGEPEFPLWGKKGENDNLFKEGRIPEPLDYSWLPGNPLSRATMVALTTRRYRFAASGNRQGTVESNEPTTILRLTGLQPWTASNARATIRRIPNEQNRHHSRRHEPAHQPR